MMKRLTFIALAGGVVLALAACGQQPQESTGQAIKQDGAPYTGVGQSQYAEGGWTAGDKGSWEQQLKSRAQYGQNDYQRIGAQQQ